MLRMERDGLFTLPPPQKGNGNGNNRPRLTSASDPGETIALGAGALGDLTFSAVSTQHDSRLWNELVERYHYLGYKPLPGAQMRYLVYAGPRLLSALGFGAAAWKVAPRDHFIGWSPEQRTRNLHLIVNNARFLILPWVTSKNLASRILAGVAKQLPQDWEQRYAYRPFLLETFVQKDRFTGASYRAANWTHVGQTQGRGKLDRKHRHSLPLKDVFLYPLHKRFRQRLSGSPPAQPAKPVH
jgi:Druantia protein DruA